MAIEIPDHFVIGGALVFDGANPVLLPLTKGLLAALVVNGVGDVTVTVDETVQNTIGLALFCQLGENQHGSTSVTIVSDTEIRVEIVDQTGAPFNPDFCALSGFRFSR